MLQHAEKTDARQGAGTVVKSPLASGARLYLAFFKGRGTVFSRLIRWWTRSTFSHVELVWKRETLSGREYCISCSSDERDGGVRCKAQTMDLADWVFVPVYSVDLAAVEAWVAAREGRKYDWAGILGMVWSPENGNPDRYFCSEFCFAALQAGGWSGGRGLRPAKVSPGELFDIAVAEREAFGAVTP